MRRGSYGKFVAIIIGLALAIKRAVAIVSMELVTSIQRAASHSISFAKC